MKKGPRAFDFLGNIAIINFPEDFKVNEKKRYAEKLMKNQRSIKTVLEKQGKIKGRLRKITTKYLAGEKTKEVLYKENGCVFRFNVDTTYFSPRLSNERKEIASKIKREDNVLVMFAGVSPFPIVIAKNSKAKKVVSNEINREANKYSKLNIELNNLKDKVELVQGDIKRVVKKWEKIRDFNRRHKKRLPFSPLRKEYEENRGFPYFDVIVMPRPQLKESFLEEAFKLSKRNTRIYYYDFCKEDEINSVVEKIKDEAKKARKKIKILKKKKAGEIAPYKIRLRVDFRIL